MPVAQWIDQLLSNFLTVGRGTSAIALKTNSTGLMEIRDSADSAYRDLRARDVRTVNLHLDSYQALSRVPVTRRQCVLAGRINTSTGQPNAMVTISGLNCQLEASTATPLVFSFAAGFDAMGGPIDYVGVLSGNQGFSGLTANATNYFYAERNTSTGATAPTINTSGQTGMAMYEWSGSVWTARQRVFVAEVVCNASNSTSAITYAYQRRYQSAWTSTPVSSIVSFAHSLGMTLAEAEATLSFMGRQNSSDANHALVNPYIVWSLGYGMLPWGVASNPRVSHSFLSGDGGLYHNGSAWVTSAELQCSIDSGW